MIKLRLRKLPNLLSLLVQLKQCPPETSEELLVFEYSMLRAVTYLKIETKFIRGTSEKLSSPSAGDLTLCS